MQYMTNINELPANLPRPVDDGKAAHLVGLSLPGTVLTSTSGEAIQLGSVLGWLVIYCYPMTGQPQVDLPTGWDQIPGARGCTPQSCSYRDHYKEIKALNAEVFGLSIQSTAYQQEMVGRLHLPFQVLSDEKYEFQKALKLPTFDVEGMTLLKRLTMIVKDGVIQKIHYPVFPSDSDPIWVIDHLKALQAK